PGLGVVGLTVAALVDRFDISLQKAVEADRPAGCDERAPRLTGRSGDDLDGDRLPAGVPHLGGEGALPDQLVQPELSTGQAGLRRGLELLTGRPDRLVRLLGVLHLAGVRPRRVRE